MSRKKRMQNLREAKDRRTKKVALGLSIVLVAVLAFEVPKMMHHGSSSSSPPPATTTTGTYTTPTATPAPTGTPAPTTAPGTAAAAGLSTASMKLPNSDALPARSVGQLYSFSHFTGKNPFAQQLSNTAPGSSTTGSGTPTSTTPPPVGQAAAVTHKQSGRLLAQTGAARISVNGSMEVVRVGASFPSSNPLFRLVALANGGVRIGIASGSYSSGAHTVALTPGRSLTLVDATDGVRYKIRLISAS